MRILLISCNEICYNTRLLKAADFFYEKGCEVVVFNPITGLASKEIYANTLKTRKWKVLEYDITKRNLKSLLRWMRVSILNKLIQLLWNNFRIQLGFDYYLSKGLLGITGNIKGNYDYILIHLVDTLPLAVKLKKKTGAKLIYDSQEYFKGQYAKYEKHLKDWVTEAETKNIKHVDILLATTNVMRDRIVNEYKLNIPSFRVRNTPSLSMLNHVAAKENNSDTSKPLLLVWHGMSVYFNNTRGVHILVKAVANCKSNVKLYLQGNINDEQVSVFNGYLNDLKLHDKIFLRPAADPDRIVESLVGYDVGLIGELPEEENQMLTSSNKLFDFINAGLAVIAPDLPGLAETLDEFSIGSKYHTGDYKELALIIDGFALNRDKLNGYKIKSSEIAKQQLYWEFDYKYVWDQMNK
ncbi:MAG: hypothetical protein JNL63_10470 [Bacteroidia bacterium]|nr:hypothetical protein [Bacteroidia bacterium]